MATDESHKTAGQKHAHQAHTEHRAPEQKAAEHHKADATKKPGFRVDPLYIIPIIIILGVLYMAIGSNSNQVVALGDNISVDYTGTFTNGTVFDTSLQEGRSPLQFKVGSGQLISGFDQAVIGMKVGDTKTVTLPPAQAYGPSNPALITQVPASAFGNQTIKKGMVVTRTTTTGQQQQGLVTAVNTTTVTVDFNSPMAGKTLIFKITIKTIQKA